MVDGSVCFAVLWIFSLQAIQSLEKSRTRYSNGARNDLRVNTTSGLFQGKEVIIRNVPVRQFLGIPYGEKPLRFEKPLLRQYNQQATLQATKRPAACLQTSDGRSYGPFSLPTLFDEDCLTLNIFIPKSQSSRPRAIMVFTHSASNQIGSASFFDGSAMAALGDVIVITINHRLSIFGFLTPDTNLLSGNYGLHDQLLALKWVSLNAQQFNGDPKRITYVGHSSGAVNALLLAMSTQSDGLLARVIAQSGCPLSRWTVDQQPPVRFDNVMERNSLKTGKRFTQSNINRLRTMPAAELRYMPHDGLDDSPNDPFPVVDNDLVSNDLKHAIRTGPLRNVDILLGVTADESLHVAEEHIFSQYLPRTHRTNCASTPTNLQTSFRRSFSVDEQTRGFSYFRKNKYIKKYLQANYPEYLCFYEEIRARYTPPSSDQHNDSEIARLYTNLVSDLMIYYDLVRFLHERLRSEPSAATYVYYYTQPRRLQSEVAHRSNSAMVGHFAELDLLWGMPFLNRSDTTMNVSYTPAETELSRQMIRYWTNFAKTGNPNSPADPSVHWPAYETTKKSFINFHAEQIQTGTHFFEERVLFWHILSHRQTCLPFHWYHTCLLVGILLLTIILLVVYIFYNNKRARRNIKPTELTARHVITTYHFLPSVVS